MAIIKDDEYYTNLGKEAVKTARETSLQQNNDLYQQQTDMANKAYETEAEQASRSYEDQYRENAVQKEINKRQVAESMANLGLTDSGLNRTQQTAVQLSYANNKANIDRNKQTNLENINLSRLQDLSSIDQKRLLSDAEINQYYDNLAQQYAADYKNADVDTYESAIKNASAKKTNIINSKNGVLSRDFSGSLSSNYVTTERYVDEKTGEARTKYIDRLTGYESDFSRDTNPYTNTVNPNTQYGTFDNGYQPNNVGKNKPLTLKDSKAFNINGQNQNVFYCKANGKYYVWDGTDNDYFEVKQKWINNQDYTWVEA